MVSSDNELPRASPESFSTTRCHRGRAPPNFRRAHFGHKCRASRSRADDGLSKREQLRTAEELPIVYCFARTNGLLEQDALFVPALEPAFGRSCQRGRRLASLRAIAAQSGGRPRSARQGRPHASGTPDGRRQCESDVVSEFSSAPDILHEHSVHAGDRSAGEGSCDDRRLGRLRSGRSGRAAMFSFETRVRSSIRSEYCASPSAPFKASSFASAPRRARRTRATSRRSRSAFEHRDRPTGL